MAKRTSIEWFKLGCADWLNDREDRFADMPLDEFEDYDAWLDAQAAYNDGMLTAAKDQARQAA